MGAAARGGNRTLIFIGDGGLQMTANDLGSFPRFGSNAIVVVRRPARLALDGLRSSSVGVHAACALPE